MRIAMVGPFGFHPNKTMRSRALQLARPLVRRGHQVKLFMPPWQTPDEAGREWQEDGVDIRYISLSGGLVGTAGRLTRETLAWKPDAVHAFKPKAYSGLVAWWLWTFRRHKIRLVTDTDDWEGWGGWNDLALYSRTQKRFFAWQERWGYAHCHSLTVASRTLQSLAWAQGVRPHKVFYLPNGPGVRVGSGESLNSSSRRTELRLADRPVILIYSRFFEFDTGRLVKILGDVRAVLPDLAILLVGMTLYQKDAVAFQAQIVEAGLGDAVFDAGWVDEAILPSTLASADAGLYLMEDTLLNRTKCPVKLVDMLYVGLPVVAEAVGQVSEYVVQRQTGLLRTSGDTDGLAADLLEILTNKAERMKLAAGAQTHIRANFTWDKLASQAERAYESP